MQFTTRRIMSGSVELTETVKMSLSGPLKVHVDFRTDISLRTVPLWAGNEVDCKCVMRFEAHMFGDTDLHQVV